MDNITKKLPIALTNFLNASNRELSHSRNRITIESSSTQIKLNSISYEEVRITYKIKNSSFYFLIHYLISGDYIGWSFYPYDELSTKPKRKDRSAVTAATYNELTAQFRTWKNIITKIDNLENPFDYFQVDNFIEFYSSELLDQIPTKDAQDKFPLPSEKQSLALKLLEKQSKFLTGEINKEEEIDSTSEKYTDLVTANKILVAIQKELPRMTAEEVKRNWSISLGIIMKWCAGQFIKFMKFDNANNNDISRTIGGFIGGIFGIPKIEDLN